jgi:hypothetical protein
MPIVDEQRHQYGKISTAMRASDPILQAVAIT